MMKMCDLTLESYYWTNDKVECPDDTYGKDFDCCVSVLDYHKLLEACEVIQLRILTNNR